MTRPSLTEPVVILRDQNGVAADEVTLDSAVTYRFRVDITRWDMVGLQIKYTGGTATMTVYGCVDRGLVDELGLDPASNPWLFELDAANQFSAPPAGSAGTDILTIAFHSLDVLVIEVDPSVDVTAWGFRALLREGRC